ncbi:acyl-CoA dehydrogenase/oxidase [Sporodiniella umbellata]|nr:acyl-CoA dehydrogenase/oxidase [Sporodiniella umbellata]
MHVKFPKHLKPAEPQGENLLLEERKRASFHSNDLMEYIYGSEYIKKRNNILQILENDSVLGDKSHRYYNGRRMRFKKSLEAARRFAELQSLYHWSDAEFLIAESLFDEASAFRLHRSMFMPTIANQGTEEQKKIYLEPALRYEIIGCYAQTELGHGSNVRGLETTATYRPETGTFVLNSPTLTSSKWWIGGLGVAANHAIVMARLITQGKDYGPHPFIVQIRNLENHEPLKGITVGDIGPKFGFNTVDNGFILFDNVHIPHIAFLARYSQIEEKTGAYVKPPNEKLTYGTMVFVRANIVLESFIVIARAATVAVRYSAIRVQGSDSSIPQKDGTRQNMETAVLDYTMQQYRLFPIIAQAYACHFTGQEMHKTYRENQEKMAQGDFSYLADLHASSSGLKSLTTTLAVAAIEECRRACGGHGYSLFSGLGQFYQDYLPKATWEGDNYLLTQQTARYLIKTMRSLATQKNKTNFSSQYLSEYMSNPKASFTQTDRFDHPESLLSAFKFRAAFLIDKAVYALDIQKVNWNDLLIDVYRISRAHCQLLLVSNFIQAAWKGPDSKVKQALQQLALLFCLSTLEQEMADFLACGYILPEQVPEVKQHLVDLLKSIRPNAVVLVDAFGIPDYMLNSALGESKGDVYKKMTAMAELEPLNQQRVVDGYEQYIRPLIYNGKKNWKIGKDGIARL